MIRVTGDAQDTLTAIVDAHTYPAQGPATKAHPIGEALLRIDLQTAVGIDAHLRLQCIAKLGTARRFARRPLRDLARHMTRRRGVACREYRAPTSGQAEFQ